MTDLRGTPLDRVLIVMMSAIGDAVHVLPVANAIKRHASQARITWVLQPGPAGLVQGHPAVDEVILFQRRAGAQSFREVIGQLRAREYDVLLDLQLSLKAGILTGFSGVPRRLGFDWRRSRDLNFLFTNRRIPARPDQHVQDQYFEFLDVLGVPAEPVEWDLGPWSSERDGQMELYRSIGAQAPGSSGRPVVPLVIATSNPEKDWVPERWADLADRLYFDFGLQPVLAGGRSERETTVERIIRERAKHPVVSTLGISLRSLVGLLEGAALVVSLDTGPMHMSVALRRPVIALMGYNNPKRVGPYRRFRDLVVDAYGDSGEDYPITRASRAGRMSRITVEDVLEKVRIWAERYRPTTGDGMVGSA